jgi:hypothetical protein
MKPYQVIPENILSKMSRKDREALGQNTAEEAIEKANHALEREEQKIFAQWLGFHHIPFVRARSDKPSTIRVGWPDFSIFRNGKTLFIEMKVYGGVLSKEQGEVAHELTTQGFFYCTERSSSDAIERTRTFFEI